MFFRLTFGPVAVLFLLISAVFCYFYPITKQVHEENMRLLKERRERAAQEAKSGQSKSG